MIAEVLAVCAFATALVGALFATLAAGRRGNPWAGLADLRTEVHEIHTGLDDVRAGLDSVRERLPRRIDGRYDLVRKVGEGGIGVVWEAMDSHVWDRVAVKLLQRRFTQDEHVRRRFIREARVARKLRHPNIVQTHDAGEDASGQLYLVMELLDGRTLRDRLEYAPNGLSLHEVLDVGTAVARALVAASELGIVHRDIKPENICAPVGQPLKIADWGLGFVTSGEAELSRVTDEGTLSGTPHYMSPEQCRGSTAITAASDVYSLGCVLYECATGRPPFSSNDVGALLVAHCNNAVPTIRGPLSELAANMMAKDPSDRPRPEQVLDVIHHIRSRQDTL